MTITDSKVDQTRHRVVIDSSFDGSATDDKTLIAAPGDGSTKLRVVGGFLTSNVNTTVTLLRTATQITNFRMVANGSLPLARDIRQGYAETQADTETLALRASAAGIITGVLFVEEV